MPAFRNKWRRFLLLPLILPFSPVTRFVSMIYMSPFIFFVLAFIFGLIIGSFLNVVIYRINTRKSLHGRSACMSCQNQLLWYELIPVFSFLGLKGRCRNCKTKISIQYPLVELMTGLIFTFLFFKFQHIFY